MELAGLRSNGGDQDIALYFDVARMPTMIQIPAGDFTMGCVNGSEDERPVHSVTLNEFYMDQYKVTNAQ